MYGDGAIRARDADFVQRLKLRLQQEPLGLADFVATDLEAYGALSTRADGMEASEYKAANDTVFRWKLLAGVASMVVVSLIGWQAGGGWGDRAGVPKLAQAPIQVPVQTHQTEVAALQPALVGGEPQVMIRDRQLDALLAAHKQFGGTSALQVPTGFLRNATFEGATR
jgi:sigma-E factor negative regulatory protein RseA